MYKRWGWCLLERETGKVIEGRIAAGRTTSRRHHGEDPWTEPW